MSVNKVSMRADAYLVCLHHALTTEREEVMGLLVGQFLPVSNYYLISKNYMNS